MGNEREGLNGLKTNYESHDVGYRRFREAGAVGWDQTDEAYRIRQREVGDVLSAGRAPRAGRLLELGCGAGNMTVWLASLGYRASGIDIAPTAIAWGRSRAAEAGVEVDFEVANVVSMDGYTGGPFDIIVDGHCLHCIIGDDRARFFASVFRLLEPGGYFLVDTMCQPVRPGAFENYDEVARATIHDGVWTRYIGTADEIAGEVRASGLEVIHAGVEDHGECSMLLLEAVRPR